MRIGYKSCQSSVILSLALVHGACCPEDIDTPQHYGDLWNYGWGVWEEVVLKQKNTVRKKLKYCPWEKNSVRDNHSVSVPRQLDTEFIKVSLCPGGCPQGQ